MAGGRFDGKTILVTGGSSGIGFGIARRFAEEGGQIAIFARGKEKGERAAADLSAISRAAFHAVDLTDETAIASGLDAVIQDFGRLDVLVNNAGIGLRRSRLPEDASAAERWEAHRGANLDSSYLMTAAALPLLAANPGAAVVNISSTGAQHGNWGLYGVAKAGVEALTRAFAAEAAPLGVRVNCISPGWIATSPEQQQEVTGGTGGSPSLLGRMGTPAEIGAAAAFLASEDASFITGQTLVADGGMMIVDHPSKGMLEDHGPKGQSRHWPPDGGS